MLNINPDQFYLALEQHDFIQVVYDDKFKMLAPSERFAKLLKILSATQLFLMDYLERVPQEEMLHNKIIISGQTHWYNVGDSCFLDWQAAIQLIENQNQNSGGFLMLEASGEVHPRKRTSLLQAGRDNDWVVVTEHELYSLTEGKQHSDGFIERDRAPLNIVERSWVMGMYLANLLAAHTDRTIVCLVGDEHIPSMIEAINYFLSHMGYWQQPKIEIRHTQYPLAKPIVSDKDTLPLRKAQERPKNPSSFWKKSSGGEKAFTRRNDGSSVNSENTNTTDMTKNQTSSTASLSTGPFSRYLTLNSLVQNFLPNKPQQQMHLYVDFEKILMDALERAECFIDFNHAHGVLLRTLDGALANPDNQPSRFDDLFVLVEDICYQVIEDLQVNAAQQYQP